MHTLKKLAAAVIVAMATGAAEAAIINGSTQPGELFVNVFDSVAQKSYALDLGITTAQLLANPSQTLVFNLAGDSNYSTFLSPQSPLVFNVAGTNQVLNDLPDIPGFGDLITSNDNVSGAIANTWNSGTVANAGVNIDTHAAALNSVTTNPNFNGSGNGSGTAGPNDGDAYFGAPTWLTNMGGGLPFSDAAGADTALNFWHLGTSDGADATATKLPNNWILTGAGKLCYGGTECSPVAAPLPAAIWLFGSGVLGMVGVARRKTIA